MKITNIFFVSIFIFFLSVISISTSYAQDTIVKKNGDIIKAKITEIGTEEVKFKIFGETDGPVITLKKSEIKTAKVAGQTIIDVKGDAENTAEDVIIKKSGDLLKVKVVDIGIDEIKFKLYNDPYGPTISIAKSDIRTMKVGGQTIIDVKGGNAEDVITKKDGTVLKAKISELGSEEVKFKLYNNPDGPSMSLKKAEIDNIKIDGQLVYEYKEDPRSISNKAILDKTSTIKFHFFSPLSHHLAVSYEWMQKPGMNWEGGLGVYGPGVSPIDKAEGRKPSGMFLRFGPKFLLGSSSDVEVEGIKYAHPLKGRYFKPEITLSAVSLAYSVTQNIYNGNGYSTPVVQNYTNKYQSLVVNLIYGRQLIYGNTITLSYYFGFGYGFENKTTIGTTSGYAFNDFDPRRYSYWYMGKNFPMTVTAGFTIGYIFRTPEWLAGKKGYPKAPTRHSMGG